jgi:hypothetical protein
MLCYSCAEQCIHQPAVALCRSCNAGLCMEHLRETASLFESDSMLATCHHDTWAIVHHASIASERTHSEDLSVDRREIEEHRPRADPRVPIRRLLFVADAAVADVDELPARVRAVLDTAAEVYVVTPTLPGRLAWLADDVDRFRHVADERLDIVLGHLRSINDRVSGDALRGSVVTVITDGVETFKPDHIMLALRSSEHANWQEHGLVEHVHGRFGLPLTTFAIDPEGHVAAAADPRTTV